MNIGSLSKGILKGLVKSLSFKTGNGGRNLIEHLLCDRHWARHLTYDITSDMQPFCKV